jgi:N-acetylglucosamine-6-phosphate deacetylase
MRKVINNARLAQPGSHGPLSQIIIDDGWISAVLPSAPAPQARAEIFEAQGRWVAPGFIDLHTHGADGADVMDATPDALRTIAQVKLTEGVTTFCPTTMTASDREIINVLRTLAHYETAEKNGLLAKTRGAHLEGPFLNSQMAGAQDPQWMRPGDVATVQPWQAAGPISLLTLAPELTGHEDLITTLVAHGVRVSLGHSAATRADFLRARAAGASHLTHFANQMSPLHHRELGLVGSGLIDDQIRLEIIADGIHLSDDMLRLLLKTVPLRRLMLITDSIAASGRPDGDYTLGGQAITVTNGQARLPHGALAGSTLRFIDGLRRLASLYEGPWTDLIITTAANQAASMGWADIGRVAVGCRADLVIFDDDFQLHATVVDGQWLS